MSELLQGEYHIIIPVLNGHAGRDRPFTTIEENASEIMSYIDEKLSGSVMPLSFKESYSHRARAVRELMDYLQSR